MARSLAVCFLVLFGCEAPSRSFESSSAVVRVEATRDGGDATDAGAGCQPSDPTLLDVIGNQARVRLLSSGAVAVADPSARSSVEVRVVEPGTPPRFRRSIPSSTAGVADLAASRGVLGIVWEEPVSGGTRVMFATVDASTGALLSRAQGSPAEDRNLDPVSAREPSIEASDDGFLVVWRDTRTADPRAQGVNLFAWQGLYAQRFGVDGQDVGGDMQLAQTGSGQRAVGVVALGQQQWLAAWTRNGSSISLFSRSGLSFSPQPERTPGTQVNERWRDARVPVARGVDGRTLVLVPFSSATGEPRFAPVLFGPATSTVLPGWNFEAAEASLRATADGYFVFFTPASKASTAQSLQVWKLGLDGSRAAEWTLPLSAVSPDATLSQPELLLTEDRLVASFVAMGPQGTAVWLATRCLR